MVFVTLNIFANEQNRGERRCCFANFTLGPSVICIYIESIRFWFIIVAILRVGAGRQGWLAGVLSPVMRPLSTNIPERRRQAIIMVLGLNWCCSFPAHSFKAEQITPGKTNTPVQDSTWALFVSLHTKVFRMGEHLQKIQFMPGCSTLRQCCEKGFKVDIHTSTIPSYKRKDRLNSGKIRGDALQMVTWQWLCCPVMEIWIIIEWLQLCVWAWCDSYWVYCKRTEELCCFYCSRCYKFRFFFSSFTLNPFRSGKVRVWSFNICAAFVRNVQGLWGKW